MERPVTLGFYRDLMPQMWHYKFVYRHASEELGHERMVVHDLKSVGICDETDLNRPPLPAT